MMMKFIMQGLLLDRAWMALLSVSLVPVAGALVD